MTNDITDIDKKALALVTQVEVDQAKAFALAAKSPATLKAYASAWRSFTAWCESRGASVLPADPNLVAVYLSSLAQSRKVPTVEKHLAAIAEAHRLKRLTPPSIDPAVVTVMKGIRREIGIAKAGKKALVLSELRNVLASTPNDLMGCRDRAILLLGFAGALRRSELVGLEVHDLSFEDEGIVMCIKRSKSDQEGQGVHLGVPYGSHRLTCPIRSCREWLEMAQIDQGPLFRPLGRAMYPEDRPLSGQTVNLIVKRAVKRAGLDPVLYGAHSLRAGMITTAAALGVDSVQLSRHTRHASLTVLREYMRPATVFLQNPAARLGL